VWQKLTEELGDRLTIIAVALDTAPGAPDEWIKAANPTYPALIDREHHVAELYNIVNVPQAVWINEEGRIVRPPEPAGAYDFLNKRTPETSQEQMAELMEQGKQARLMYLDAIRDWVARGEASRYAYSEAEARAHFAQPDDSIRHAHANFRLGQHLIAKGRAEEGNAFVAEAKRLHPESWAMFREAAEKLVGGPMPGIAGGADFAARVAERAAANKPYYAPIDIDGIPS
jgi:hypothetical protein